jgi:hypothetical protein
MRNFTSRRRESGFQPILFDQIGVYQSDGRGSWPVKHTLRTAP